MKTTVEIPDALLDEARKLAARHDTTLRELIIESLRRVLDERKRPTGFKLRDGSVDGEGVQTDLAGASWEAIRELVYDKRGG
ncbi:MAG TPA: DUF2191 domain-containing protein [Casimicrobiaceae bacterium]|nr:DUF2191 domain-containing protein [Casimicrobiaceae bacterium]